MTVDPAGAWLKTSPKMRGPLARLSWDAELVWWKMYLYCADVGNDGRMPLSELHVAVDRKITAKKARTAFDELVSLGFVDLDVDVAVLDWKDQPLAADWKDPVARERWLRRKRLTNDQSLCKRIKDRDRHLCRYCGIRVNWNIKQETKNHPEAGTYDHVDPDGDNSLENVVVACRRCNGRKKDRTPEQWIAADPSQGRTLKRPGTTVEQADAIDAARIRGPAPVQPDASPVPASPLRARARPDRAGPGPALGQPAADRHMPADDRVPAVPPPDDDSFPGEDVA